MPSQLWAKLNSGHLGSLHPYQYCLPIHRPRRLWHRRTAARRAPGTPRRAAGARGSRLRTERRKAPPGGGGRRGSGGNDAPAGRNARGPRGQPQGPAQAGVDAGGGESRPVAVAVPGSRLPAPGSRLPAPGSRLPAPGSRLPAPGSRLPAPGSRLPAPGSRLPAPGSRLPAPGSRLPAPGSRLPAPGSRLPAPGSRLPAPGSRLRLPAPGSRLPAPGSRLPAPGSRLPAPGLLYRLHQESPALQAASSTISPIQPVVATQQTEPAPGARRHAADATPRNARPSGSTARRAPAARCAYQTGTRIPDALNHVRVFLSRSCGLSGVFRAIPPRNGRAPARGPSSVARIRRRRKSPGRAAPPGAGGNPSGKGRLPKRSRPRRREIVLAA